jgi:hypothetical protein
MPKRHPSKPKMPFFLGFEPPSSVVFVRDIGPDRFMVFFSFSIPSESAGS